MVDPHLEQILAHVEYTVPERMMMSDELKKVVAALTTLCEALDSQATPSTVHIHELWSSVGIPMQYVQNIFEVRLHEAAHKAGMH